ncbi:DNA N-6-adenine-methyltransferase [Rhodopseudomonas pseudopalustris]|uniref:DNA N-6-adenine-methyltransferase (Dam) n=1 Tax=Rhodopseudomonas pseudopalustris TaxID=1513892 RepID=A0A1H8WH99_9BRAD|nr:DNA N-6-adenine-methyltransferase [Rhodopseudomonas pseudopalustris]SEP27030.1 DNA N-6-adenine-methyltransferase (Dam) [Rhodopseudomonas pseudopalustris]
MKGMGGHHSPAAESDVWLTPPEIIAALGPFDLDPCAAPEPRPWPTAAWHITLPENGLRSPWCGRVWLNPPYSTADIKAWLPRLVDHGSGTALIFARTETDSFFRFVWERADAVLFLRTPRLHFHYPDGRRAENNCGAPSALCAYGEYDAYRLETSGIRGKFIRLREPAGLFA